MRKFYVLLVLSLLWTTPIVAQSKTDKDRDQLVGPVKSVKAYLVIDGKRRPWYTTTYDTEGNIAERISYDSAGEISAKYKHTYDANGRSTGYEEYAALLDKTFTIPRRHVYTLDETGRKIEYTVFESDGSFGTRFVYKYDAKGNLVEERWIFHTGQLGGRTVSTYDEKGQQTSQENYLEDGALNWNMNSKYDANGNKTESVQYYGKTLRYRTRFAYDSKGRIIEREIAEFNSPRQPGVLPMSHAPEPGKVVYTYDDEKRTKEVATYKVDGTLKDKIVYAYDEQKNEIGRTALNADGSAKNNELMNIEYDSHGNWTSKTSLRKSENGGPPQPYHAELRVITYHN